MAKYKTHQEYLELAESMKDYAVNTDVPILKEWCCFNNMLVDEVFNHGEFDAAKDFLVAKKEVDLERLGLRDKKNTMAIFSLKQQGWSDKKEVQVSTDLAEFKQAMQDLQSEDDEDDEV